MPKGKVRIRVICPLQKEKKWAKKKRNLSFFIVRFISIVDDEFCLWYLTYAEKCTKKTIEKRFIKKNEIERMKIIKTT